MKRWTRMDFHGVPPQRIAGVRVALDGEMQCQLEIETDIGSFFFGGPVTDDHPTLAPSADACEPFLYGGGILHLPHTFFARACILHHDDTVGRSYTITEFVPIYIGPNDYETLQSNTSLHHTRSVA